MERRRLVNNQIRQIEEERLERIEQAPCGPHVMVRLLARVMGADMLVHEVLSRNLRDRRAVATKRPFVSMLSFSDLTLSPMDLISRWASSSTSSISGI